MAVPKRKVSKSKVASRVRANWPATRMSQACPQCGSSRVPHRVCPECGYYRGRQVLTVETD